LNPTTHNCLLFGLLFLSVELHADTSKAGVLDPGKLREIDNAFVEAIGRGSIPGAVLWLESKGEVYHKAYGKRMTSPSAEKMTVDTIFDVASLTKVLATTPAVLHLFERGLIDLDAPVSQYIPEFLEGGIRPEPKDEKVVPEDREKITVKHLITHQSGLPPGIFLSEGDFWGYEEGVRRAATVGLIERPGTRFRYSDVNFILLGEIVRRVSGERLDRYVEDRIFDQLELQGTGYLPTAFAQELIAPTTEMQGYGLLRGVVHDPTARRMQGVAGHAGLFSRAEDIAAIVRMMLRGGRFGTRQILQTGTIDLATSNQLPADLGKKRGLGWDIESPFSYQRGEKFPRSGFGHTGWTGTSIWVDPASDTFVILLANRNHPTEDGSIKPLRIRVGTLAAEAVGYSAPVPLVQMKDDEPRAQTAAGGDGVVLNGIDVLERDGFPLLKGKKIGLITNQTGINRERRSTIDLLATADGVTLVSLFSPEHGIRGVLEVDSVDDSRDAATGLPIHSLYKSEKKKPSPEQLKGLDALVFDIQDIGCRFYTYISTMGLAMEAAAEAKIQFIVLDRVNPIGGMVVDGPVRTGTGNDFVAFHEIPVQHGMTVGELAQMFNAERKVGADLQVVRVEGWNPQMHFGKTGLPWVNPSPNIRNSSQALLYPGVGLIEFTNVSVGRGTRTPFEHIGAPWIHEGRLAAALQSQGLSGVSFLPTRFTPESSVYDGEDCGGVRFIVTDRKTFRPVELGMALMSTIYEMHGDTFTLKEKGNVLLRHEKTLEAVVKGDSPDKIRKGWSEPFEDFLKRREAFLLYPRK
jgi:uncharacterized protein YbbC (DUF1343 family)